MARRMSKKNKKKPAARKRTAGAQTPAAGKKPAARKRTAGAKKPPAAKKSPPAKRTPSAKKTPPARKTPSAKKKPGRVLVTVDGAARPVRSATLSLSLRTEAWSPAAKEWLYGPEQLAVDASLEVRVDEHSGEDGALAPDAQSIPLVRAAGGRPPALDALPGLVVDDQGDWEAWFGNDAPPLEGNRLLFGPWVARDAIEVEWTATYGDGELLRVAGPVRFLGLSLMVKAPADEEAFLEQTFGAAALAGFRRVEEEAVDFGPGMPEGRRLWTRVRYARR